MYLPTCFLEFDIYHFIKIVIGWLTQTGLYLSYMVFVILKSPQLQEAFEIFAGNISLLFEQR